MRKHDYHTLSFFAEAFQHPAVFNGKTLEHAFSGCGKEPNGLGKQPSQVPVKLPHHALDFSVGFCRERPGHIDSNDRFAVTAQPHGQYKKNERKAV